MKPVINSKYIQRFYLFLIILIGVNGFSQNTSTRLLDSLFNAHDNFDTNIVNDLLTKIVEEELPQNNKQDSITKGFYKIIKYLNTSYPEFLECKNCYKDYLESIEFLNINVGVDYLPEFINDIAQRAIAQNIFDDRILILLDQSLDYTKYKLDGSRVFSEKNYIKSLQNKILILTEGIIVRNEELKNELVNISMEAIDYFDENKLVFESRNYNDLMLYNFFTAIEIYSDNSELKYGILSRYIIALFEFGKDDHYLSLEDNFNKRILVEFSSLRALSQKVNDYQKLSELNIKFKDELDEITYLTNKLVLEDHFNLDDLEKVLNLIDSKINSEYYNLLSSNLSDLNMKYSTNRVINSDRERKLVYRLLIKTYEYKNRWGNKNENNLLEIEGILLFLEIHGASNYIENKIKFEKEKYKILKSLFEGGDLEKIGSLAYFDVIFFLKKMLEYNEYEEPKDKIIFYVNLYNETLGDDYEKEVSFISSFYSGILLSGYQSANNLQINDLIDNIKEALRDEITYVDLMLRIDLSKSISELDKLYQFLISNQNDNILYTTQDFHMAISIRYNELDSNIENGVRAYNYFINNYDNINYEQIYFSSIMSIIVDYNIQFELNKFISIAMDFYLNNSLNISDLDNFDLQETFAMFYEYIGNESIARHYYYKQIYNPYFDSSEMLIYDRFMIYYNMFFSYYRDSNEIECKNYIGYFESYLNEFKKIHLKEVSKRDETDINLANNKFEKIESLFVIMQRAYYLLIDDFISERIFIDKMLESEYTNKFKAEKISLYNLYNLKRLSKSNLRIKLEELYIKYERELDDNYFSNYAIFNDPIIAFNNYLRSSSQILENTAYYNEMSIENQGFLFHKLMKKEIILLGLLVDIPENEIQKYSLKYLNYLFDLDALEKRNITIYSNVETNLIDSLFILRKKSLISLNNGNNDDYVNFKIKLDNLEQKLKKGEKVQQISVESLQNQLNNKQAYVRIVTNYNGEYFEYYCFIIKKEEVKFLKLNKDGVNFERIFNLYYKNIIEKKSNFSFFQVFYEPIINELNNIEEIFMQNDEVYNNLNPLSLFYNNEPLLNQYSIINMSSVTHFFRTKKTTDYKNALLFGNPEFYLASPQIINKEKDTLNILSTTRGKLKDLPYTQIEIDELNKILLENNITTIVLTKEEATESNFENAIGTDILHIATHGFYIDKEESDSFNWGVFASGAQNLLDSHSVSKNYSPNGVIYGSEIELMNMTKTKLVILSACQTGVGTTGLFGNGSLATSFLNAGADNVISTLWPVDDEITKEFMISFYTELMIIKDVRNALIITQKKFYKKYKDPYYWAPFILIE